MINIEDLCKRLNNNIEEKKLYFKNLSSPIFLKYFIQYDVINLTDPATSYVLQYLINIYNNTTANDIISILQTNIGQYPNMPYWDYTTLIKLINKYDKLELFNNRELLEDILNNPYSIELLIYFFKHIDILNYPIIYKKSIEVLFKYKLQKNYNGEIAVSIHEEYYLAKIFTNQEILQNLLRILTQTDMQTSKEFMEEYESIHNIVYPNKNTFIEIIEEQSLSDNFSEQSIYSNEGNNVLKIMTTLLNIALINFPNENNNLITLLMQSNLFIHKKILLNAINKKHIELSYLLNSLLTYINNINNIEDFDLALKYCMNKLVPVLNKTNPLDDNEETLIEILNKIDNNKLKYEILHGLKNYTRFQPLFLELKTKFQYEIEEPGIYFSHAVGGTIIHKSPITQDEFQSLSIQEQLNYINEDRVYPNDWIQKEDGYIEEISEYGLIDVFKSCVAINPDKYLSHKDIKNITKKNFIISFISVLKEKITEINLKKAFKYIQKILITKQLFDIQRAVIDFIIAFMDKKSELYLDFKYTIQELIVLLSDKNEDFSNFEQYDDNKIGMYALNTNFGLLIYIFFRGLCIDKELSKENIDIIKNYLKGENFANDTERELFLYWLGEFYCFLFEKLKTARLIPLIIKMDNNMKKSFIDSYLLRMRYINGFERLQDIILLMFSENNLQQKSREHLIKMLTTLYIKQKALKNSYLEFLPYFTQDDYTKSIETTLYSENFSKDQLEKFWKTFLQNENYTNLEDEQLRLFHKFATNDDYKKYHEELKKILKSYQGTDITREYYIDQFLEKILEIAKLRFDSSIIYNYVDLCIPIVANIKYKYKSPEMLAQIINELNLYDNSNASILASLFRQTSELIIYSDKLSL